MSSLYNQSRSIGALTGLQFVILSLLFLITSACEDEVNPFIGTELPYTVWGMVNPEADTQAVRVFIIDDILKLVSPDPLDATVSIVDLVNSNRFVLQDSVIQLPNGDYRHIYWSEFDVAHFDIYRLEVERFDGQLTKSSQIQVPGPISLTVALNNTTVLSDLIQTIIIEGNPPATPRIDVRYDAFTVTPAGTRLQDNPVTLSYANKTSVFNDTLRLGIDLQADFRTISEDFDAKDIVGLICIDKIVVDVHVGNKEWKSPTGVFDPDFLVEPGTFTNIENGFGFFGAGFVETLSFLPDEISLIRAGFFDCDG